MAQWLQLQIAEQKGIAANFAFPMPASFIWQLYAENLPDVAQSNQFNKNAMMWRLMCLIPQYLEQEAFHPLRHYLAHSVQSEQFKLYQLAGKSPIYSTNIWFTAQTGSLLGRRIVMRRFVINLKPN